MSHAGIMAALYYGGWDKYGLSLVTIRELREPRTPSGGT